MFVVSVSFQFHGCDCFSDATPPVFLQTCTNPVRNPGFSDQFNQLYSTDKSDFSTLGLDLAYRNPGYVELTLVYRGLALWLQNKFKSRFDQFSI